MKLFEILESIKSGEFNLNDPESNGKLLHKIGDTFEVSTQTFFITSNLGFLEILKALPHDLKEEALNEHFFNIVSLNDSVCLVEQGVTVQSSRDDDDGSDSDTSSELSDSESAPEYYSLHQLYIKMRLNDHNFLNEKDNEELIEDIGGYFYVGDTLYEIKGTDDFLEFLEVMHEEMSKVEGVIDEARINKYFKECDKHLCGFRLEPQMHSIEQPSTLFSIVQQYRDKSAKQDELYFITDPNYITFNNEASKNYIFIGNSVMVGDKRYGIVNPATTLGEFVPDVLDPEVCCYRGECCYQKRAEAEQGALNRFINLIHVLAEIGKIENEEICNQYFQGLLRLNANLPLENGMCEYVEPKTVVPLVSANGLRVTSASGSEREDDDAGKGGGFDDDEDDVLPLSSPRPVPAAVPQTPPNPNPTGSTNPTKQGGFDKPKGKKEESFFSICRSNNLACTAICALMVVGAAEIACRFYGTSLPTLLSRMVEKSIGRA